MFCDWIEPILLIKSNSSVRLFFDDKGREMDALFDTFPILCIGTESGVCEASLGVIYTENMEQILRLVRHKWLQ